MANLVLTTRLIGGDAQREQKNSHDGSRDDTTNIWRSEKLQFGETSKRCSIDLIPRVELS